jgi:hypothetical protein
MYTVHRTYLLVRQTLIISLKSVTQLTFANGDALYFLSCKKCSFKYPDELNASKN